jgi:signal transduction histidine kinase
VKTAKAQGGSAIFEVVLERVNSHVEICIEDTGIGIAAEFLPYVFDRFRQGDQTTTRRYGGLGLGLSIVKSLVELHGGSVRVKSPGENCNANPPVWFSRPSTRTGCPTSIMRRV